MFRSEVPPPAEVMMPVTFAPSAAKYPLASATAKGMPFAETA